VTSAEIGRPAAEVFAYATDPARFSEWQKGVVNGHLDGPADQITNTNTFWQARLAGRFPALCRGHRHGTLAATVTTIGTARSGLPPA
jgi:hypothetical protein